MEKRRKVNFREKVELIIFIPDVFSKKEVTWNFIKQRWDWFDYEMAQDRWKKAFTNITTEIEFSVIECPNCRTLYKSLKFVYENLYCCVKCDEQYNPNPFSPLNKQNVKTFLDLKWQKIILNTD